MTDFVNYTKGDIVKVKIGENLKARAFLDSGAEVCLLMEKYVKLLEGSGLYQRVHWPLTAILADFSVVTYRILLISMPGILLFRGPLYMAYNSSGVLFESGVLFFRAVLFELILTHGLTHGSTFKKSSLSSNSKLVFFSIHCIYFLIESYLRA